MSAKSMGQSVAKGSAILLIANFMVKIIGAMFKIPLQHLIGDEGMGYFNAAYNIYSGLFIVATAGLPVAVSKMVSESMVQGNLRETKRIYRTAYAIFLAIGIIGSGALFLFADKWAATTKFANSNIAVMAIAPSILFVSLMSVYRGFFQGMSNMIPTAISEVVEASGKLIIGYLLAYLLLNRGLHIAASGAVLGVTAGSLMSLIILAVIHAKKKKAIYENIDNTAQPAKTGTILKKLLMIAIPVTISASVFTLTNMIDTVLIGRNLDSIKHLISETPVVLYGRYTSKAVVLYNMPPTLVMSLCLALVPAIARAFVVKDMKTVRVTTTQSLKAAYVFALPCAVGLGTLASPILKILFKTDDAALLLQLIAPAVVFVSMVLVTNAILQATGNVLVPVANIFVGGVAKVVINYVLVSNPAININGAPIGTTVCYFIYMFLNLIYIKKVTKADIGISFWIRPLLAAVVMGVVAYFVYGILNGVLGDSFIMTLASFVISGGFSGVAYLLTLLVFGGVSKEDILSFPKGEKIAEILAKLKLLRG